ncbi:MAG: hypothetical protein M3065_14420, partial [Actinomycetota bacterium]|nr:hypothetical protein [Actinomycetota bacterium]
IGLPLSFAGVLAMLALTFGRPPRLCTVRPLAVSSVLMLVFLFAMTAPASAHDPGQGPPAGTFDFTARLHTELLNVTARRAGNDCPQLAPAQLVARRAGQVEQGTLTRAGCAFHGTVRLPSEGRWFVYLDAHKRGSTLESWIPVKVAEGADHFTAHQRFAYIADRKPATTVKWIVGTIMYALVLAFLAAILTLVRRTGSSQPTSPLVTPTQS